MSPACTCVSPRACVCVRVCNCVCKFGRECARFRACVPVRALRMSASVRSARVSACGHNSKSERGLVRTCAHARLWMRVGASSGRDIFFFLEQDTELPFPELNQKPTLTQQEQHPHCGQQTLRGWNGVVQGSSEELCVNPV